MTRLKLKLMLAGLLILSGSSAALAGRCEDLSYQRNAIFKVDGYCFKTAAQIRTFGNDGCRYPDQADVPLSARDRADIAAILSKERASGCR